MSIFISETANIESLLPVRDRLFWLQRPKCSTLLHITSEMTGAFCKLHENQGVRHMRKARQ